MRQVRLLILVVVAAWSVTAFGQGSVTVFEGARVIVGDARPPIENASFVVTALSCEQSSTTGTNRRLSA